MLFTWPVLKAYWEGVKEILKYIFELQVQGQHWLGIYLKGKIRAKGIYIFKYTDNCLKVGDQSMETTKYTKIKNMGTLKNKV